MKLRLLYFEVCGYELCSGLWRTRWKIGRQSIIYRSRYLSPWYVTNKFRRRFSYGGYSRSRLLAIRSVYRNRLVAAWWSMVRGGIKSIWGNWAIVAFASNSFRNQWRIRIYFLYIIFFIPCCNICLDSTYNCANVSDLFPLMGKRLYFTLICSENRWHIFPCSWVSRWVMNAYYKYEQQCRGAWMPRNSFWVSADGATSPTFHSKSQLPHYTPHQKPLKTPCKNQKSQTP